MVKTSITKVEPNRLVTRGYRQDELIGNVPYGHVIYLLLKGELPTEEQGRMMEAILVSSIDHGLTPPTCLATRTIASSGVPLPTAVAGGLLAVGDYHGGAIDRCMEILYGMAKRMEEEGKSAEEIAEVTLAELREQKRRFPGLGHRIHTDDPRTKKLFSLAEELGIAGVHIQLLKAAQTVLAKKGKSLPINVDGAIAAVACDIKAWKSFLPPREGLWSRSTSVRGDYKGETYEEDGYGGAGVRRA